MAPFSTGSSSSSEVSRVEKILWDSYAQKCVDGTNAEVSLTFLGDCVFTTTCLILRERNLLEHQYFKKTSVFDDLNVHIIDKTKMGTTSLILTKFEGVVKAISDRNLRKFALVLSTDDDDENAVEAYTWTFYYDRVGSPRARLDSGEDSDRKRLAEIEYKDPEQAKHQLRSILTSLRSIISTLHPLPVDAVPSFRVAYCPGTPKTYQAKGFLPSPVFYRMQQHQHFRLGQLRFRKELSLVTLRTVYADVLNQSPGESGSSYDSATMRRRRDRDSMSLDSEENELLKQSNKKAIEQLNLRLSTQKAVPLEDFSFDVDNGNAGLEFQPNESASTIGRPNTAMSGTNRTSAMTTFPETVTDEKSTSDSSGMLESVRDVYDIIDDDIEHEVVDYNKRNDQTELTEEPVNIDSVNASPEKMPEVVEKTTNDPETAANADEESSGTISPKRKSGKQKEQKKENVVHEKRVTRRSAQQKEPVITKTPEKQLSHDADENIDVSDDEVVDNAGKSAQSPDALQLSNKTPKRRQLTKKQMNALRRSVNKLVVDVSQNNESKEANVTAEDDLSTAERSMEVEVGTEARFNKRDGSTSPEKEIEGNESLRSTQSIRSIQSVQRVIDARNLDIIVEPNLDTSMRVNDISQDAGTQVLPPPQVENVEIPMKKQKTIEKKLMLRTRKTPLLQHPPGKYARSSPLAKKARVSDPDVTPPMPPPMPAENPTVAEDQQARIEAPPSSSSSSYARSSPLAKKKRAPTISPHQTPPMPSSDHVAEPEDMQPRSEPTASVSSPPPAKYAKSTQFSKLTESSCISSNEAHVGSSSTESASSNDSKYAKSTPFKRFQQRERRD